MRHNTYVPLALFFIIIFVASKSFATPISDLQDIGDWLSVTLTKSGFTTSPEQYRGFSLEEWGNGPSTPVKTLPPGYSETHLIFATTLFNPNHHMGRAAQQFLIGYTGSMSISNSFAGAGPPAFGIGQEASTPLMSGLLSNIVPVPEPGTMLLFGTGLLGLASLRHRRKG
jgi:hypothetical protein